MPQTIKIAVVVLAYAIGISLPSLLPALPSLFIIAFIGFFSLCLTVIILYRSLWSWLPIAGVMIGATMSLSYGKWFQYNQLPTALESKIVVIEGKVIGIPVENEQLARFLFKGSCSKKNSPSIKVRLNWYTAPNLRFGQRWRLKVKLRRPHGFASLGAMDFEAWAAREGIQAIGYVLSGELLSQPKTYSIREKLSHWLSASVSKENLGVLKALLVGDKSEIQEKQWQLLNNTGTSHLVVISGLHIGLLIVLGHWLALLFSRMGLLPLRYIPLPRIGAIFSLCLAYCYGGIAGFAVPVQRALIMTTVAMLGPLFGLRPAPATLLVLALAVVVTLDPLAVTSVGFWYSFSAVSVLIYGLSGRYGKVNRVGQWLRPQWLIFFVMTPLLLFNGQSISLISPWINLVAIPFVGLVLVPLLLLSAVIYQVSSSGALELLGFIEYLLSGFWWALNFCAHDLLGFSVMHIPAWPILLCAIAGGMLLISPLPGLLRLLAPAFLMPWGFSSFQKLDEGQAAVTVLDVGQGLSVLVHTKWHTLIYDTGDAFSHRFNAADCVIVPYLHRAGIGKVDRIVISHNDKDHVGGLAYLLKQYNCNDIMCSMAIPSIKNKITFCKAGDQWKWDGVEFKVLASGGDWGKTNDRSCVLKVTAGDESLLLTGDISHRVESSLLCFKESLASTVLLAPHHGSRFSSSCSFLQAVNPRDVLFSSGYKNRFGHPAQATLSRVTSQGATIWNTAWHGSLSFTLGQGLPDISAYRYSHRRYWWYDSPL